MKTTLRALILMMNSNIETSKKDCDFFIEPALCDKFNIFDLKHADEAYEIGISEATQLLPKLKKYCNFLKLSIHGVLTLQVFLF